MNAQVDLTVGQIEITSPHENLTVRKRTTFYFGMAVAMSIIVFIGFGPSFYLNAYFAKAVNIPPVSIWPTLLLVHGLVFSGWMVLLMVQTGLVVKAQIRWHRRTGLVGAALAASMVAVGTAAQLAQTHRMLSTGEFDNNFVLGPGVFFGALLSMVVFAALVGSAVYLRRRPEAHKRLTLLATAAIIGAATGRIAGMLGVAIPAIGQFPYLSLLMTDLFVFALLSTMCVPADGCIPPHFGEACLFWRCRR